MRQARAIVGEFGYRSIADEDAQRPHRSIRRRMDGRRLRRAASCAVIRALAFRRHARPIAVISRKTSMSNWIQATPQMAAAFLGSSVEAVEAMTVVLAAGAVRGWRPAL